MTLVNFPFDLIDARNLHKKADSDPVPTRPNLCAKITQVLLSLGYLLYDTISQNAPGPGTTTLVVVACLSDLLVLGCESYTLYKAYKTITTEENNPEGSRVVAMLGIIKDLRTELRIRDAEMEARTAARDAHFEAILIHPPDTPQTV